MRTKKRLSGILAGLTVGAVILSMAGPALAKGKPPKPTTTTTTEAPAAAPSCYERVRLLGASGWAYDPVTEEETQWNGSAYVQTGIPACIDIDQPGHTAALTWSVTWTGGATARPMKGMKLIFERGVHGTTYAEHISTEVAGEWIVTIDPEGLEPLVLVAMPRQGDKWATPPTFAVTPSASQ